MICTDYAQEDHKYVLRK